MAVEHRGKDLAAVGVVACKFQFLRPRGNERLVGLDELRISAKDSFFGQEFGKFRGAVTDLALA
jgi:hypothetical protein